MRKKGAQPTRLLIVFLHQCGSSAAELARHLGKPDTTVRNWATRGIPDLYAGDVAAALGVSRRRVQPFVSGYVPGNIRWERRQARARG